MLVLLLLRTAEEGLGSSLLRQLRVIVARTRRVLGQIRRSLNISNALLECVAFLLMRLGVAAHISIDVIVVSRSGLDKVLGRVLVWLVIGLSTSAPC